jgi:hypothetical protein
MKENSNTNDILEKAMQAKETDTGEQSHIGRVLINLSTQYRLPSSAETEAQHQEVQQAITRYLSDDVMLNAYLGVLPPVDPNTTYSSLSSLRLIVPFIADTDNRNGIREEHQLLATFSKRLWDLRKDPTVLIRRFDVIDRKKTRLNTLRVRINKSTEISNVQEADLYVIGLHGNGAHSHHVLGNTLSVAKRIVSTSKADVKAIEILSFDYRGSVASPGSHDGVNDLADQAVDQVIDLLQQGIPAEKIVLHGHSLGGLVGVIAANKLMEEGHSIHYFGDRLPNSVDDLSAVVAGSFASILSGPARFFSKRLFPAYQCDASDLYLKLPPTHRACLASKKDETVLFDGSLVGILRSRHNIDEGIIVDDLYHMTPLGNLGIYSNHYTPDENPFFQFLLKRVQVANPLTNGAGSSGR